MTKNLIILLLFLFSIIGCKSQVGFLGVEDKIHLNQRFGHGVEYLVGNQSYEGGCVLESTILKVGDSAFIYYTAHHDTSAIALMTTHRIGETQNKRGIVIHPRSSGLNDIVISGGTFYLFGVDWNGAGNCYLYTSTNGYSFTDQGIIFPFTLIPHGTYYGNIGILKDTSGAPIQVGGKYKIIAEANTTDNFLFELHLLESVSLSGPWTYVQKLTSLQIGVGSYSGPCLKILDGVYYLFYHYSQSGVLPTDLAFATSTDLINWTVKEYQMKGLEELPYGAFNPNDFTVGTSQIADQWVEQIGSDVHMIAEYVQNSNPPQMVIYHWVYHGSFKQLVTGLVNCIGCIGIYP